MNVALGGKGVAGWVFLLSNEFLLLNEYRIPVTCFDSLACSNYTRHVQDKLFTFAVGNILMKGFLAAVRNGRSRGQGFYFRHYLHVVRKRELATGGLEIGLWERRWDGNALEVLSNLISHGR